MSEFLTPVLQGTDTDPLGLWFASPALQCILAHQSLTDGAGLQFAS